MFDSVFNVLQIVITLEIYGVTEIVGIPFGYRGFSDKELMEIPVISYFPSKQQLIRLKFDAKSIELELFLMLSSNIVITFTAVKESRSKHSSLRWQPIRSFTRRTWS